MNKIDYQGLREKAEKATCGVWSLEYGEGRFDGDDALIHREAAGYIPICRIEGAHPESGFDEDFQMEQQANAEFIAAANPATVLALLDENERMCRDLIARNGEIEWLRKWAEELEAREVALPVASCIVEDGEMCIDGFGEYVGHSLPDDWQLVPKKITLEMECALSKADSYEIGWLWALAAAPKYEVQNAKRVQNALNSCRAAMLHGAEPVNQTYKSPQTQFKQVADLYEMQFDDGRTCTFHTDAQKAVQWLQACDGNRVQEYVKLERLQNALSGNYPVTPDGWISCSERMPEMGERQCYVLAADFKNNYPPNIPNTQVGVYGDWFNDGNPTWDDGDGEDLYLKEVTHWMPLPEPPRLKEL